ncbi:MAG: acetoacetate--CoA ligase, partial [Gemmatimonadaceae bacterium]
MTGEHVDSTPLWSPGPDRARATNLAGFIAAARASGYQPPPGDAAVDYPSLYAWSIAEPDRFWPAVWKFCGVVADTLPNGTQWTEVVHGLDRMAPPDAVMGPRWFLGARINFAENLLRYRDDHPALIGRNELGRGRTVTYAELAVEVADVAAALRASGVGVGDRVAGFMPNIPEAVIAMLATASLGAVWSSCSPDFGVKGVLDRFGQIEPKVLFCADGYRYAGKEIDSLPRVREIAQQIPTIARVIVVPYRSGSTGGFDSWQTFRERRPAVIPSVARDRDPPDREARFPVPGSPFPRFDFDHPLYIMYSSGTTGLPKCMVHGAGGTLLQHLKELVLHTDLRRDDRIFYFTTCGWMMWNWLVSSLAVGATVVLYDGAPMAPANDSLWTMADEERLTVFGTSAKYLAMVEKLGVAPMRTHHLGALRAILSTGSPLAPPSFDYVYRDVKRDVQLASISGGTDIISCFALGNPAGAVWRGELQARGLGMAVDVFDQTGHPIRGEPGELVCTKPFPSMPVAFWNDPDGSKYRSAYFDTYPGAWRHGDWAELTEHGGLIISGRSDATLNPGGIRIGTAEIYRQVEQLPEVIESLVIGQDVETNGAVDTRVVLFVRLAPNETLTDALRDRIRRQIREGASPHHVPKVIVQVADIPRTISGKITELAVRDVIHGRPVKNAEALANPQALELFRDLKELSAKGSD